jgi:hypothetical protein
MRKFSPQQTNQNKSPGLPNQKEVAWFNLPAVLDNEQRKNRSEPAIRQSRI